MLTQDPIGLAGGVNLYEYAGSNPVSFSDPYGLCPVPPTNCLDVAMAVASVGVFVAAPSVATGIDAALDVVGALPGVPSTGVLRRVIKVSKSRFGDAAEHIQDAQAAGKASELTVRRAGAAANRKEAMRGVAKKQGKDRDEYPPAMFEEGGAGASVRHVSPSNNRGAGACLAAQCRDLPDGAKVKIEVVP